MNALFCLIDLYKPLHKLSIVLNIVEEKVADDGANRIVEEFSDSNEDESLTEKNITIGSKEFGHYGPDYEEEKFELINPKGDLKKTNLEEKRPKTPPKTEPPLIPNFGPKFNKPQIKDDFNLGDTQNEEILRGQQTAMNPPVSKLTIERFESSQTPLPAGAMTADPLHKPETKDKEESKAEPTPFRTPQRPIEKSDSGRSTPKEGKILTPNLPTGGFTAGEFEKAIKSAKETKDYNYLHYEKE
jgi:hypothetical protein